MFLDLSLFEPGGRHLLVGGGGFRKGVWRLLICLLVSFRVEVAEEGEGRRGRLARGDTSRETDYCMSAVIERILEAAYLACFIFAPVMCMLQT
jgi:hypothetical protein